MICNFCKQKEATVSVEQVSDGVSKNIYLCKDCAKKLGLGSFSENIDISVTNLFKNSDLFSPTKLEASSACPHCGQKLTDIHLNQKIGCSECLNIFKQDIISILQSKRKDIIYMGKIPIEPAKEFMHNISVLELKQQLKKAVEEEKYEVAAILRDELKELELSDVNKS